MAQAEQFMKEIPTLEQLHELMAMLWEAAQFR
jgi:hypothetical protein